MPEIPTPPSERPAAVTVLLARAQAGDRSVTNELFPLVYEELRSLADRYLAAEPRGHTLQPTALVHEAYLRLVGPAESGWESRAHFFGAAARAIRRILIDRARARAASISIRSASSGRSRPSTSWRWTRRSTSWPRATRPRRRS